MSCIALEVFCFTKLRKCQSSHYLNFLFHNIDILLFLQFKLKSRTVKEIEANLCFAIFGKNSKIQNGRHFWGGENFLTSHTVKEIEANLCFAIFGKNSKIQNGRQFRGGEIFF